MGVNEKKKALAIILQDAAHTSVGKYQTVKQFDILSIPIEENSKGSLVFENLDEATTLFTEHAKGKTEHQVREDLREIISAIYTNENAPFRLKILMEVTEHNPWPLQ